MASPSSDNRLANLDLLRLLAAVSVVVYHYCYQSSAAPGYLPFAYPEVAPLARELWCGVSFFFIISGFVIAWSAEKHDALSFAISRAARLYPAYLVAMCVTAAAMLAFAPPGLDEFRISLTRWLANLMMIPKLLGQSHIDGVYWSIVIEIIFYGWVAVLLALGVFKRRQLALLALWVGLALANEMLLHDKIAQYCLITRYAGYFALGILSYRCHAQERRPWAVEVAIGVAALGSCLLADQDHIAWMQANLGYEAAWSLPFAAMKLLAMLALLNMAVRVPPIIRPSWCLVLGGLTYPLYLLHMNLGYMIMHRVSGTLDRWSALALAAAIVVLLAWLILRFVEPVGRRLIMRLGMTMRAQLTLLRPAGMREV